MLAAAHTSATLTSPTFTVRVDCVRAPLFFAGDPTLLARPLVTVVGTRHPTPAGLARASRLARELAAAGVVVVSGLALGIDAAAHRAALAAGGHTIAVLGTPLDVAYPAVHATLQAEIGRGHLLLSQFATGAAVTRGNFPRRDRVLAAIAGAVVVVEAGDRSGALYTAAEAARLGRPLFVPRSVLAQPLAWPARFLGRPATFVLSETAQVLRAL